jgi:hypothetical protein
MVHIYLIYMLLLLEKPRGEARNHSKQQCSFCHREELVGKDLSHFSPFSNVYRTGHNRIEANKYDSLKY